MQTLLPMRKKAKKSTFDVVALLLSASIMSMQFYTFESGKPQLSHILLTLFFIASFFVKPTNKLPYIDTKRWKQAKQTFTIYTFLTLIINGVYFFITQSTSFLTSSIFNVYNLLVFISVSGFLIKKPLMLKQFVVIPAIFSLLFLVAFHSTGLGRYDFYPRYNGFFNDPNQMAFWALCTFSMIALSTKNKVYILITFLLTLWICVISMSRSALLGLSSIILGVTLSTISGALKKPIYIASIIFLFLIIGSFGIISIEKLSENRFITSYINRAEDTNISAQMDIRGYSLPKKYPENFLIGSGQGDMGRFQMEGEIHSTWIGVPFYYGLAGLALFLSLIFIVQKSLSFRQKLIFLGPMLYSFSTYGARTPIFYIFLAVVFVTSIDNAKKSQSIKDTRSNARYCS